MSMAKDYYGSFEYGEYENYDCEEHEDNGYEWTEEDSWDAVTDGMYGDMPAERDVQEGIGAVSLLHPSSNIGKPHILAFSLHASRRVAFILVLGYI